MGARRQASVFAGFTDQRPALRPSGLLLLSWGLSITLIFGLGVLCWGVADQSGERDEPAGHSPVAEVVFFHSLPPASTAAGGSALLAEPSAAPLEGGSEPVAEHAPADRPAAAPEPVAVSRPVQSPPRTRRRETAGPQLRRSRTAQQPGRARKAARRSSPSARSAEPHGGPAVGEVPEAGSTGAGAAAEAQESGPPPPEASSAASEPTAPLLPASGGGAGTEPAGEPAASSGSSEQNGARAGLTGPSAGGGDTGRSAPVVLPAGAAPPRRLNPEIKPVYPERARAHGLEGEVVVQVVVHRDGKLELVGFIASDPRFDEAVRRVLPALRYRPALLQGRPVAVYRNIRFPFRLE